MIFNDIKAILGLCVFVLAMFIAIVSLAGIAGVLFIMQIVLPVTFLLLVNYTINKKLN